LIIRFKEGIIKRLKGILPLELGLKMLHNPGKLPRPYGRVSGEKDEGRIESSFGVKGREEDYRAEP